jgi:hypothetical protein
LPLAGLKQPKKSAVDPGNPAGIRRYSDAGCPLTYKDVTGAEVHNDGEIHGAAMNA